MAVLVMVAFMCFYECPLENQVPVPETIYHHSLLLPGSCVVSCFPVGLPQPMMKYLWRVDHLQCPSTCGQDVPAAKCQCACRTPEMPGDDPGQVRNKKCPVLLLYTTTGTLTRKRYDSGPSRVPVARYSFRGIARHVLSTSFGLSSE